MYKRRRVTIFKFLPSRDSSTIALQIDGKATKEDAQNLDQYVKYEFGEDKPFNILAIFQDVDGATLKGITEGTKFDAKRWNQFNKFAVVSDMDLVRAATKVGNYLPGVTSEHFAMNQMEEAWDWIQQ